MKMPEFIRQEAESILLDWEKFACTLRPAARDLTRGELRDSAAEILHGIAAEMEASQSRAERRTKGESDPEPPPDVKDIAKEHASDRLMQRFTLDQMAAEYRGLRASVTRRWTEHLEAHGAEELEELTRFNEAVDSSMAVAIRWFNGRLEDTQARLCAADQAKDEFLAVLGHELRNPLAPLSTGLQLLKQAQHKPDLLSSLPPMMERQLAHLVRLVDDLLDISRISRGKITLQLAEVDLHAPIEAAVEQMGPLIERRRHRLAVRHLDQPLPVAGDFERLTQVIANLLSNAARYMENGGTITLESEAQNGQAVVRVRDRGYGIAPEQFDRIFELFSQVPEHRAQTGGGGLGVGLALSRQLIQMHGGTIEATSDGVGEGSEFVVRLPLSGRDHQPDTPDAIEKAHGVVRRVQVIEDNVDAADSLRLMLELMGHAVESAYDGPAALRQIANFDPDIVLLDLGLPGMDGIEVARRIRQRPRGDEVLIVAVTGWGQEEARQRTRLADFDEHLVKPISADELSRVLLGSRQPR